MSFSVMEKMLTQHNIIAESPHVEAIPVNFIATEDGRTLLAVTERKDGILEIVATPVTFVGQSGTTASLVDVKNLNGNLMLHSPLFHMNVESLANEPEARQPAQNPQTHPSSVDRVKFHPCVELKVEKAEALEFQSLPETDFFLNQEYNSLDRRKSVDVPAKASNPGRPKKSPAKSLQGTDCLKCDICHQEFVKQTLYRKHMENHAEEKPHRCPKCSASFNVPTNFTLHMATHNTGEPKCPECGKKFARMASLKSHMLVHEKEENLFCTECEDAFSTKAQLDAHLKLHGEKWSTEEVRKCKLCNKQFGQPALYRLHIREHYKAKIVKQTKKGTKHKVMHKCTICLKSFQKPSQLMRHIRVHTGEKPFKCTVCSRAFTQKSSLQIHTWQHNGIRPHACKLCNAKFSQKGNLNAHIMRVHSIPEGEPIYSCSYCTCVFKKLGSLNGHMKRMHTDVKEESSATGSSQSDDVESDIRATVNSVINQLASLESTATEAAKPTNLENTVALSQSFITKKDILQQALKNSGLPSKNKAASEGTCNSKTLDPRTSFVTLLDRTPDGSTRKYLTIKQRCDGNVRWYACSFCHKEFKKPSDLIRHLRVHTQEKPFKCTYCYRSFALKSTMIAHERTHSSGKRYSCGSCDKTFACHGSLMAHTKLHGKSSDPVERKSTESEERNSIYGSDGVDVYSIGRSRTQGKSKSKLSQDAENLIPRVVLQEPLVISDAGNEICVAQVPSKEKRSCDATVDPARPHKCCVCQVAFRKISHLKQHHRRHTGERPYKCTKCDRRFTSNSVLKSHLHTHDDSRPYGCSICSAKFSTQSSMKRHLVTHSNRRPFMCPYCHKTFKTYVNCRKHMKIHKHELAERLAEQTLKTRMQNLENVNANERCKREAALDPCYASGVSDVSPCVASSIAGCSTTPAIAAPSSSTYSDSLALPRIGSVEISFQPQLGAEFSETLAEFESAAEEKQGARPTFIDQSVSRIAVANLENSQTLNADETGSVAMPVYTDDQPLTPAYIVPESIREIEDTLNQQFLNIGLNLNLGSSQARHSNGTNIAGFSGAKEQQHRPVLNVIYGNDEDDENNGNDSTEASDGHVFASQLDTFEMEHIALQSDAEVDIELDASNSASMSSLILPRCTKEEHGLSVSVATSNNPSTDAPGKSSMQTIVFISQENLTRKESSVNVLEMDDAIKDPPQQRHQQQQQQQQQQQCAINPILLTKEFRGMQRASINVAETVGPGGNKASRVESLLQCHMCGQQGFTAIGLKEHLTSHRGSKEYQCPECFSRFCTSGGLIRHSKIHVGSGKQSLKCPSREKHFDDKVQLQTRGKVDESAMWNRVPPGAEHAATGVLSPLEAQSIANGNASWSDPALDSDAAVSEKVLLDTVAEREVMDRVETDLTGERERKEYTNRCKYCPKTFRKPSDLVRHVRTHTGERPYKCDYCSKSFAVKCTLDSHTKVHTGKKTFRCHVCNSLFATKGSLKVHMRLHTGSKPFKCPICELRFRTSGHRKVHLTKHAREHKDDSKRKQKHSRVAAIAEVAAESLEKCDGRGDGITGCGISEQQLQEEQLPEDAAAEYSHLEAINIDASASCLTDQMNFDDAGIVSSNNQAVVSVNDSNQLVTNLHFLLTNGLVTIQTEEALLAESSTSVDNSQHHRLTIISDNAIPVATSDANPTANENENENETVANSTAPMDSFAKVSGEKPLLETAGKRTIKGNSSKECDICGKTFTKPYQVERHKRIHTGERPYKCDLCAKSFAQKSTLQMHQKHHTGDRPYACPYCEYSFTQKGNLRTHVKRVHQLDTVDVKRWKRARQSFLPRVSSVQETTIDAKCLTLDDVSFVEFLK